MKHIHDIEKQQFVTLFEQEGIDNIEARFRILEIFLQTERHISMEELAGLVKESGHVVDMDLLKDTLELMCNFGFAEKNSFGNGRVLYEHRHLGDHHDHMICTKCGEITEFTNEQLEHLQEIITAGFGFHMLQHKMEIYGICSACQKKRAPLMPLMLAKAGEKLVIRQINGGGGFQARLASMGIRRGDTLEVVTSQGRGQFVVAVESKRYILGRGMTQKIMVEPAK